MKTGIPETKIGKDKSVIYNSPVCNTYFTKNMILYKKTGNFT